MIPACLAPITRVPQAVVLAPSVLGAPLPGSKAIANQPLVETVLAEAAARFREAFPVVELRIEGTWRAGELRRLAGCEAEMRCGDIDADEALHGFLRREKFMELTAGIVA